MDFIFDVREWLVVWNGHRAYRRKLFIAYIQSSQHFFFSLPQLVSIDVFLYQFHIFTCLFTIWWVIHKVFWTWRWAIACNTITFVLTTSRRISYPWIIFNCHTCICSLDIKFKIIMFLAWQLFIDIYVACTLLGRYQELLCFYLSRWTFKHCIVMKNIFLQNMI